MDGSMANPATAGMQPLGFFAVALGLSLLTALSEVAGAYHDRPKPWRAVINPWALPLYLLYLLLTFLLGQVLLEHGAISPSWTTAVALGVLGPALFKTQAKLFQPISGQGGLNANIERLTRGMQRFCFSQINASLSYRRIASKERLAREDRKLLKERVRTLYGVEHFDNDIHPLIEERARDAPETVNAFLVDLIERKDPSFLDRPVRTD